MSRQTTYTRILFLGLITLVSGIAWVGSEIYHRYVTDLITPDFKAEIQTLSPRLNLEVLEKLNGKQTLPVDFAPLPPVPDTAVTLPTSSPDFSSPNPDSIPNS